MSRRGHGPERMFCFWKGARTVKEIVVIAPTREIYDAALRIVEKRRYDNVDVVPGNMSEGAHAAVEAVAAGARVLVTRGGTYRLCCEAVNVPISEIKVTAYDIIQTLKNAEIRDNVIGVVGYNNVVDGFDILGELLPYDIVKIELNSEEQVGEFIASYREQGIRTYVGDANTIRISKALGCDGIVINSQPESIYAAIREARRILRATFIQKARVQQLETITDFVRDGVVAIDEAERVTVLNRAAAEALRVDAKSSIGMHILDIWPQCALPSVMREGRGELGRLEDIYGLGVVSSRVPIIVDGNINGAVQTFQSVSELQDIEQSVRRSLSRKGFVAKYRFRDVVCKSAVMKKCVENAREFSKYDSPVLILGESGVGKALFAQAIHTASPRKKGPFVEVNCAALPPSSMESELFGYADGARSRQGRPGLVELAHGGTIFFSEISELTAEVQGRLLRVLQNKEVMRIGTEKVIPIDVRVICSSEKDLPRLTEEGRFRRDLYYRINVLNLSLPPLRARREDIIVLADYFNAMYSKRFNKAPLELGGHATETLTAGRYDGNVRQLQSLIERCVILSSFEMPPASGEAEDWLQPEGGASSGELPDLKTMENRYISRVLESTGGNVSRACAILGIDRSTLWRRMKKA